MAIAPPVTVADRIDHRTANVAVLGQGYVGLVVAMEACDAGFPVVGFEIDERKAAMLASGTSYVEDVEDAHLRSALNAGYRPTSDPSDLEGFDVAVISVPTPLDEGRPDLRAIEEAAQSVARVIRPGCLVILESTTYPGTTREMIAGTIEHEAGLVAGRDYHLAYSPERIDPGNGAYGLANTPKIVAGYDEESLRLAHQFFSIFVEKLVPVSTLEVAELAKLIENTFRHVNIALVNELAMFGGDLGVDVWEAIDAAATKPFGFMAFRPGPGVGGHCLPVDPSYLSWSVKRRLGETFRFIELANDINAYMPRYVVQRVQDMLNRDRVAINGARVLVLGLAYKPGTGDAREAPSLPIIERLRDQGALVCAVDPHVRSFPLPAGVEYCGDLTAERLSDADLVLLVTDHDEFDYDFVARHAQRIFDTRHRLRETAGGAKIETL